MPGALARASLRVLVVLTSSRVFTAVALNAEFFTLLSWLPTTITSPSCVDDFIFMFSFTRSPALMATGTSTFSKPTEEQTRV